MSERENFVAEAMEALARIRTPVPALELFGWDEERTPAQLDELLAYGREKWGALIELRTDVTGLPAAFGYYFAEPVPVDQET